MPGDCGISVPAMSTQPTSPSDVIFSPDGTRSDSFPDDPGQVTKIVIGNLGGNDGAVSAETIEWLKWSDYPNLANLHIRNITGLREISDLPPHLEWLDVQQCPDLESISQIESPELESLVLKDLPALQSVPVGPAKPRLFELLFDQCPRLESPIITQWLRHSPALRRFDVSGNLEITALTEWPDALVDIRCNACQNLEIIPPWPPQLRRIELAGAALKDLAAFPDSVDYVNLGGMRKLTELPAWGKARTLILHNSSVLMPPASQHGATAAANVAAATRAYFRDVEEVGRGEVKRCKIMVLGNGSAGKTCLSLKLTGGQPERTRKDYEPACDRISTTHGVAFHEMKRKVPDEVTIHVWDFGGQEIYHNTHRLFLSAGTVFVLLWNPDQDGQKPDNPDDKWRPLTYWMDYIRLACPVEPSIAIVCRGDRSDTQEELEEKLKGQIGEKSYAEVDFFVIDALSEQYQAGLGLLDEWIVTRAAHIISSQGTCVPSYWAIAQDMVEGWVERLNSDDREFAAGHQHVTIRQFGDHLVDEINRVLSRSPGRYEELEGALRGEPKYRLTPDHIIRVLEFLSHSGWVFWNPDLYEGRAIVGQQWALQGIYTLLKRPESHPESEVHEKLKESGGRFTRSDLHEWGWKEIYSDSEQSLLFTFLEQINLCFTLDRNEWWREEKREYISVNHLPTAPLDDWELDLKRIGDESSARSETMDRSPLHRGHWQQLLANLAKVFGAAGHYARNAFYVETVEGQAALIRARFDPDFLKGTIRVETRGRVDGDGSFHDSLVEQVGGALDKLAIGEAVEAMRELGTPKPKEPIEVFISYTWNPFDESDHEYTYEEPVDYIYDALVKDPDIKPLRDKGEIEDKGSINDFMERISETSYAIVVYSDKYFRSQYCVWEFLTLLDAYAESSHSGYEKNLILIEHESSKIQSVGGRNRIIEDWQEKTDDDLHIRMTQLNPPVMSMEELRVRVINLVSHQIPQIFTRKGMNKYWGRDEPEEIVRWIKESINKSDNSQKKLEPR